MSKNEVQVAIAIIMTMSPLAGCSHKTAPAEHDSEQSQIFVGQAKAFGGEDQKADREPPRFIPTKLRPSPMTARLPSTYLYAITHRWQPYANGIWDVAELGFDLDTLGPAPSTSVYLRPTAGKTIGISLGGYGRTFRWLANTTDAAMVKNHVLLPGDHVVRDVAEGELDGSPTIISCRNSCTARLTLTPDFAGGFSSVSREPGYGPAGTSLEISFAPELLPRWKEIRRDALCFAGAVISNADRPKASKLTNRSCVAVGKAIDAKMRK